MKRFKLVIVEDDEDERFFMAEAFKNFDGFELVAEFANGDQVLQWLEGHPEPTPELVLSDINMPGKNGYDVISEVARSFPQIPVFAMSTSNVIFTREKCLQLGARDFLAKPDVFIAYDRFASNLYELASQTFSSN